MSGSLSHRLILAACAWVIGLTVLGGLVLTFAFQRAATASFDVALNDQLRELVAGLTTAGAGQWQLSQPPGDSRYGDIYSGRYWQVEDQEGRRERSRSLWDSRLATCPAGPAGGPEWLSPEGPDGRPLRAIRQRIALPRRTQPVCVQVAVSRAALDAEIAQFTRTLVLALAVLAGGLLVAVWLQVSFGLRPLRRLAGQVRAVREGRADRIDGRHPVEIQPVVDELDAVLAHNRRLVERARSSSADLAHALKTPLSVMAAEVQRPGEDWRGTVDRQLQRMQALVQRHLGRAAVVGAGSGRRTPVRPVLEDLFGAMRRIHAARGIAFHCTAGDDAVFIGEREDLEELLGNLLDNAGKWARSRVDVEVTQDRDGLRIRIGDDGPGLTPAQREAATERGRRFDERAPGSGLGLGIVDDIAGSYDGHLRLDAGASGGLLAELWFPMPATNAA